MTLPAGFFDEMYAVSPDPWGFGTRWYEQRKRALTAAALTRRSYGRAFEPGCSIGTLTAVLAGRCESLLATDSSAAAVTTASAALAGHRHVEVLRMQVPDQWPDGSFDLVVLSEMGYYLDSTDLQRMVRATVGSLAAGATLLGCHWRHPVAGYPATGDEVHAVVDAAPELSRAVRHEEEDLLLDVWTKGRVPSVAREEGLVG